MVLSIRNEVFLFISYLLLLVMQSTRLLEFIFDEEMYASNSYKHFLEEWFYLMVYASLLLYFNGFQSNWPHKIFGVLIGIYYYLCVLLSIYGTDLS